VQLIEQRLGLLQVKRVEAFGEPGVDRCTGFAAGSDELAKLARKDQDLNVESDRLDSALIFASEPNRRDASTEKMIKERLNSIAVEKANVETALHQRFPNFAALSKPGPLSVGDTQALLAEDEALLVLDFDQRSYGWVITRSSADWFELMITAEDLEKKVKELRVAFIENVDITAAEQASFELTLRSQTVIEAASKPMIAFADPIFSKSAKRASRQQVAMRGITGFATGAQIDVSALAETLEQLPSTRDEVQTIAKLLNVNASDIKLGRTVSVTHV
jgi:hypothetical protein